MRAIWTGITGIFLLLPCGSEGAESPSLSVVDATLHPGATGMLVVSGHIDGDSTFGVTVMAQIFTRAGNTGTVIYTPAPPTDIVQLGDPWEGVGTFDAYDTDAPGFDWFFSTLNGSVDDNGGFTPSPVIFDGALTGFPIVASEDASGIWDVVLSTDAGASGWEDLVTTLTPGTITVFDPTEVPTVSEWGMVVLAALLLTAGTLAAGWRRRPRAARTARIDSRPSGPLTGGILHFPPRRDASPGEVSLSGPSSRLDGV